MAQVAALLSAFQAIVRIIRTVSTIRDLAGGDAPRAITVADLQRVVEGENARFFATVAFADIQTIHNQFYRVWLPSVVARNNITASDINSPSGTLFHIFQNLINAKDRLARLMNRVREVFRTYAESLHVDELVGGVLAFIHGFGLLLHIHAVYAELRRIQIGAASLDDRRLLVDTRTALQYLADAHAAIGLFPQNRYLQGRRLRLITDIIRNPGGNVVPPSYSFRDSYSPRRTTTPNLVLFPLAPYRPDSLSSQARARRERHIGNVENTMRAVFSNPADQARNQLVWLGNQLRERERLQGGARVPIRPSQARTRALQSSALDEGELGEFEIDSGAQDASESEGHLGLGGDTKGDGDGSFAASAGADAFVELSEKLRTRDASEGELSTDDAAIGDDPFNVDESDLSMDVGWTAAEDVEYHVV